MKSKNTKTKANGKKQQFKGKQILVVGLVALVLAAGYYRWTLGTIKPDAVSVSGTATPETTPGSESAETFWSKNNSGENKDNNNEEDKNNDKGNSGSGENNQQNSGKSEEGDTNTENKSENTNTDTADVINRARQDKDKLRGETMDKWKEISSGKDASESAKKEAENNIVKLTKYSENENNIETNVKSKGFDDCFAQVSDNGVSVIVKAENLDSAAVAQIKDIIIAETGVSASQIKISSQS